MKAGFAEAMILQLRPEGWAVGEKSRGGGDTLAFRLQYMEGWGGMDLALDFSGNMIVRLLI